MNQISIKSRSEVSSLIRKHSESKLFEDHIIVSVNDYEDGLLFSKKHDNLLSLMFSDITPALVAKYGIEGLFTKKQARQVVEHLTPERIQDKKILIHCFAGISRSGAIGTWIAEQLNHDIADLHCKHPRVFPNSWVLKLLREESGSTRTENYDRLLRPYMFS